MLKPKKEKKEIARTAVLLDEIEDVARRPLPPLPAIRLPPPTARRPQPTERGRGRRGRGGGGEEKKIRIGERKSHLFLPRALLALSLPRTLFLLLHFMHIQ
jgi:hypothetical protein